MLAKNSDVPFSKVLSDFREWAQYPPDSRPLTALDVDQLRFEKIELPFTPMPIVEEGKPKVTYGNMNPDKVKKVVVEHIVNGRVVSDYVVATGN